MGRKPSNVTIWPLVPEQMSAPEQYRRGEETGMVYCPIRRASIAIMRCGEYQARDGCAHGCESAVPLGAIAALRAEMHRDDSVPGMKKGTPLSRPDIAQHDYGMCVTCRVRDAEYSLTRQCQACYRKRRSTKPCERCARPKKTWSGRYCKNCSAVGNKGGKKRAAQMRAARGRE